MTQLTAVIHEESLSTGEPVFVSHCPELDVTSQGATRDEAFANLEESVRGILEVATPAEIERRLRLGATVKLMQVAA
ncbi:MAG TPA: type II toxin-antitoxin system HicB family antitoxin [Abditibacteriaceae bacterium]|jgi:predicted RNase H-like HicB family nuclease